MDIGIHSISNEDYHADTTAISHSALTLFEKAPRVYQYQVLLNNKDDSTAAQDKGSAFHMLLLEPDRFYSTYFSDGPAYIQCQNRTRKLYKDLFKQLELNNQNKKMIKHNDYVDIHGMLDSVSKALVKGALKVGEPEKSIVWVDPKSEVLCKARPDFMRDDGIIVEVKTTQDASESSFVKAVEKYKYYRQAAFQLRGATIATGRTYNRHVILAVEKTPPYLHKVYEMPEQFIWEGDREIDSLLKEFKVCQSNNVWPGLPNEDEVSLLFPTDYFIKRVTQELEENE